MKSLGPPFLIAALQRRPKVLILSFTATVLLTVATLQTASLWLRHDRVIESAEARVGNLAFVLAEYVRGSFALADASLRQLSIHARRVGGATAPGEAWDAILASARASQPGSGSISVTDANGVIRRSTQPAIVGQSRRDNYVFKQLAASDRDDLVVDRPFLSPVEPKRFLIPIGRRLVTDAGTFDGTVVAVVMPEAFREFFRTVDVGDDGIISVFHPDGVVLFREPSEKDPMGETATGNPILLTAQQKPGVGLVRGSIESGGPEYLSAYRTSGGMPPLIVAVSLSKGEILSDWQRQIQTSLTAFVALTLTLALMVRVLFRQMDERTKIQQELGDVQRLEAARLRETNERLEEALEREQRARRETEAASYLKDEFLMTVSHELRTPLTAIYGWVRMLAADRDAADEQRRRALAAVERNARAQTRLIDDLLDVSRAISGKLRLDARPVSVAEIAARRHRDGCAGAGSQIDSTSSPRSTPRCGPVVVDPDRMQQIVWNLLSNAIKFTPEGGTVRLALIRRDSTIEIAVSDSGVGIDAEFLPYVFERFRQADAGSRRRFGGLGLGLAIVRHLVELHGGTVSAESQGEGKGATFRVMLPIRANRPDTAAFPVALPPVLAGSSPARLDGVRILVVDDEPDARELFASILETAGGTVLTASSARDALRILEDDGAQVLLSDIEMPGEDGYELLHRTRANPRLAHLIAVAVTAYARTVDRRRALAAGFDWHLAKPVEPAELVALVASLVDRRLPGRV